MNYGYIYKITNMVNGKVYIGQHKCKKGIITETDMISDGYWGSGKVLAQAKKKYGIENFKKEIICVCENKEDLDILEILCITLAKTEYSENCYNIASGGEGGNIIKYKSEEEKAVIYAKLSEAAAKIWLNKTELEKTAAKKKELETKANKSEKEKAVTRVKQSKSEKEAWSNKTELEKTAAKKKELETKANKTEKEKAYTRAKQSESQKKAWSNKTEQEKAATRVKQSEAATRREANKTEEEKVVTSKKKSKAKSPYENIYGVNKETGERTEVFATMYEARAFVAKKGYLHTSHIAECLSGERKYAYGYYWFCEKKN